MGSKRWIMPRGGFETSVMRLWGLLCRVTTASVGLTMPRCYSSRSRGHPHACLPVELLRGTG